jgi:hypothetical protein
MSITVQLPPTLSPDTDRAHNAALLLLTLEAEIREQADEDRLLFHLVNSLRQLVPYDQAMAWSTVRPNAGWTLRTVSGLPVADRHTPLAQALQRQLRRWQQRGQLHAAAALELDQADDDDSVLADFPLRQGFWLPLTLDQGSPRSGCLFLRVEPFNPREKLLLQRLGATYSHALNALAPRRSLLRRLPLSRRSAGIAAVVLLALAFIPVRLSVMAPVEVVADRPFVLTAPINGVIRNVLVAPNAAVVAGQPLVQFEDIQPRNEMVLAQQQLAVAEAKDRRTAAAAFHDVDAAHETAIASAEHDLARVSYNYAVEVLQRTRVDSATEGLAVYSDRRDWEGRSVMVGEEILQVADPQRIAYRVDLSTANAIELERDNPVSIYLESAPLGGISARLVSVSYTPKTNAAGTTSYTLMAAGDGSELPRIGSRGTARVYGGHAPLIVQLLRRPFAAARQFLGV